MRTPQLSRQDRRFERQINAILRDFPWAKGPLAVLRHRALILIRLPLALILFVGGFLAVLPVFGLWMFPLAFLLLAVDIPALRGPVGNTIIRLRRRLDVWRHRRR